MPLQDLSPELRTRLSRVEKVVGWFVILATLIFLGGFGFYIYSTAESRGWFVTKINFATGVNDAAGFKVGDEVKLMGLTVGTITRIVPNEPSSLRGLTIFFNIRDPYYGYIWYDSHVKIVSDFIGNRFLQVEKGRTGQPSTFMNGEKELLVLNRYLAWEKFKAMTNAPGANTNQVNDQLMEMIKTQTNVFYTNAIQAGYTKPVDLTRPPESRNYYWIPPLDTPALADRLNTVVDSVETALPNVLKLTNQLAGILNNANSAVAHLDSVLAKVDPIMTNVAVITGNLRDPNGSLGNWLFPTNIATHLEETLQSATATLKSARTTLDSTDTNVTMLAVDLDHTLEHLSDLTSNLAWQVQMNTNLVTEISTTIVHTDGLIQGLKREWFLRSAFKEKKVKSSDKKKDQ